MNKQTVGYIILSEPIIITKRFEVAAWWQKIEVPAGRYPVTYDKNGAGFVSCLVEGIVTDEYMAPLFGGVPFAPTRKDNIGKSAVVSIGPIYGYEFANCLANGKIEYLNATCELAENVSLSRRFVKSDYKDFYMYSLVL